MPETIQFAERAVKDRIIGILSAIEEPLPAAAVAKFAKTTAEEVEKITHDAANGIEISGNDEKLYMAKTATRAQQGDLKWAHAAIADSILSRIPNFGKRYEGR